MNIDHISVRADVKVGSVLRYLRLLEDLPDHTDKLMVVDRENRYQGVLRLSRQGPIMTVELVRDVMDAEFKPLNILISSSEMTREFEDMVERTAQVVREDGGVSGRLP